MTSWELLVNHWLDSIWWHRYNSYNPLLTQVSVTLSKSVIVIEMVCPTCGVSGIHGNSERFHEFQRLTALPSAEANELWIEIKNFKIHVGHIMKTHLQWSPLEFSRSGWAIKTARNEWMELKCRTEEQPNQEFSGSSRKSLIVLLALCKHASASEKFRLRFFFFRCTVVVVNLFCSHWLYWESMEYAIVVASPIAKLSEMYSHTLLGHSISSASLISTFQT